ncbi:hypothetical protein ACHHYP_16005 [Achlya hypogyna]|uniref:FYVE-type domain-containing protein n=1 Tax=Achlya hypogyna TaxID=1202772 RepID=A0A1V9ZEE3_ACHHY|nr:hypothetical protein ACHHYP_16005 [Achlya hypogyna]
MAFTLPRGVFQTPPLTSDQRAALVEEGKQNLRDFVVSVMNKQQNALVWDPVGETHGVTLFQASDPKHQHDKNLLQYRALAKINATLDEIAALHTFNTRAMCDQYRRYYAHDIMDMRPLYVLGTPDHPLAQMYIKWSVYQSPMSLIKDRDFIYLEVMTSQDEFVLDCGRRGWAFCQSSIELPSCPPLHQFDIVRGHISGAGCVFLETDKPGYLEVIYHLGLDIKGSVPHFVRQMALKRRGKSITRLDKYIHEMRLSQLTLQPKSSGPSGPLPKHCATCNVSFRFRSSKICQSCGQVVCSKCSRKWAIHMPQNTKADVRVCHGCSLSVRDGSIWERNHGVTASASASSGTRLRGLESASMPEVYRPSMRHDDILGHDLTLSMPRATLRPSDARRPSAASQTSDSSRESMLNHGCDLSYVEVYGPPMSPMRRASAAARSVGQRRRSSVATRASLAKPPMSGPVRYKADDPLDLNGEFDIRYPLPDGYFSAPLLDAAVEAEYIELGDTNLAMFVASATQPMKLATWTPIGQTSGVNLFQQHATAAKARLIPYRAVAKISATIDEVARLHAFETRAKCFEYMRCYASDILDIIPLYSFVNRTPSAPHHQVYIKWAAVQAPLSIIHNRDYVYLEGQNKVTLPSGRAGWAYVQSSIELPCCPPLKQLDLVRGRLEHTGCLFLETDTPGVLDVIYHIASDFRGAIPHFARHLAVRARARKITMVDDYVHQQRLRQTLLEVNALCVGARSGFGDQNSANLVGSRKWSMPQDASAAAPMRVCHACSRNVRTSLPPPSDPGLRSIESMSENYLDDDSWSTEPPATTAVDMSYLQVYETMPRKSRVPRKSSLDLPPRVSLMRSRHMSEDDALSDYSTDPSALYSVDGLVDPMITLRAHISSNNP